MVEVCVVIWCVLLLAYSVESVMPRWWRRRQCVRDFLERRTPASAPFRPALRRRGRCPTGCGPELLTVAASLVRLASQHLATSSERTYSSQPSHIADPLP